MSLTIEMVDDLEKFEAMQGEWNELVESMTCPEVFYLWEWNFHYFRHYRKGDNLMIVVVRDASRTIVGIAPLCRKTVRRLGCAVRVMQTIVVDLADYRNFLISRRCAPRQDRIRDFGFPVPKTSCMGRYGVDAAVLARCHNDASRERCTGSTGVERTSERRHACGGPALPRGQDGGRHRATTPGAQPPEGARETGIPDQSWLHRT